MFEVKNNKNEMIKILLSIYGQNKFNVVKFL